MKVLMHTCCAPCSVYCIKSLREEGIEPTLYWYNPNIHPYVEYQTRKETLIKYSKMVNVELILDEYYGLDTFCQNVSSDIKNRCLYCYRVRIEQTVKYAKENGFDAFTSTLFVSPYQQHYRIKAICEEMAKKYDIEFLYRDFRVGFKLGQQMAREAGLYMQKYCGCVFSEEERYLSTVPPKLQIPEGFEFLDPIRPEVKREDKTAEIIKMIVDSHLNEEDIDSYIDESEIYSLKKEDEILTVAVIKKIDKHTVELKDIVTKEDKRLKGYARTLIKSLCGNYKQKYNQMLVTLNGEIVPFFMKMGFCDFVKITNEENNNKIIYSKDLSKK